MKSVAFSAHDCLIVTAQQLHFPKGKTVHKE